MGLQFSFNLEKLVPYLVRDEVDRETIPTKSTTSANSVEVSLSRLREVKVYNQIHTHNIDTSSKKISTDETPCGTFPKVIKNSKNMN